jgi:trehalose 6-phosphate phosphatase
MPAMKNILAMEQLEELRRFSSSKVLLAFDFDGTLAAIEDEPSAVSLAPHTRELLAQLTARYPVVVISGRAQADVSRHVHGLGVLAIVGNHGCEHDDARLAARHAEQVRRWQPTLQACAASLPGLVLEDKLYSVSVHYRKAEDSAHARTVIMQAAAQLDDARLITGKRVINLVPLGAADKGSALAHEQDRLACDCAVYAGDDDTDEDVFLRGTREPDRCWLGIHVGSHYGSAATHFIPNQPAIADLLQLLIDLRAG